jgi:hypothetical protein
MGMGMRSSLEWKRSSLVWMRSSQVVRTSDCQFRSRNGPGFDTNIHQHSGICRAADESVLNTVHREKKSKKILLLEMGRQKKGKKREKEEWKRETVYKRRYKEKKKEKRKKEGKERKTEMR